MVFYAADISIVGAAGIENTGAGGIAPIFKGGGGGIPCPVLTTMFGAGGIPFIGGPLRFKGGAEGIPLKEGAEGIPLKGGAGGAFALTNGGAGGAFGLKVGAGGIFALKVTPYY